MVGRNIVIALAGGVLVFALQAPAHATEPAWWTQQKVDCGIDLNTAYNDWVANGSPCPGQASQSGGSAPNNAAGDLATSMVMSMMGGDTRGAALSGGLLLGLGLLNAGTQTPEQAAAQRRQQEAAVAAEAARRQAAYAEEQRQEQLRLERNRQLLASLHGSIDNTELSMRELDTAERLTLRPMGTVVDANGASAQATSVRQGSNGAPFFGLPTTPEQSHEYVLINQMRTHVAALGWSEEEQQRLTSILTDNAETYQLTNDSITYLWASARARGNDPQVAVDAAAGQGPDLYAAGWQSGRYADCTIFALATASGVPYGVVAARAAELVRAAEWRPAADRANPLSVFTPNRGGLNGGETAILAETFGQAQSVRFEQFADTLRAGHPVMVSIATTDGVRQGKHEVVLSRVFESGGDTWFEIVDSGNRDPNQRTRMTAFQLEHLITESGVSIVPGSAVPMLRSN